MNSENKLVRQIATASDAGERIDRYISSIEGISSRSRAALLISSNMVKLNGKDVKASTALREGDVIEIEIPASTPTELVPYDIPLDIVFEDDDVIVVNKPSGLVVHPAAGHANDTLVNALIDKIGNLSMGFGEKRPGIVHRLDKETSGLLVIAKNDAAQEKLVTQFKARSIHRIYQAVLVGDRLPDQGTIESYLARKEGDRIRFASVLDEDKKIQRVKEPESSVGKWAITDYQILSRSKGLSFAQLKLRTGRTHQIRVHVSELGHPIVGDDMYSAMLKVRNLASPALRRELLALPRFYLHARELGFEHPRTGEKMNFLREWPDEDLARIKSWGLQP